MIKEGEKMSKKLPCKHCKIIMSVFDAEDKNNIVCVDCFERISLDNQFAHIEETRGRNR